MGHSGQVLAVWKKKKRKKRLELDVLFVFSWLMCVCLCACGCDLKKDIKKTQLTFQGFSLDAQGLSHAVPGVFVVDKMQFNHKQVI